MMKHRIFALTLIFLAEVASAQTLVPKLYRSRPGAPLITEQNDDKVIPTRYGVLGINEERVLTYGGKPVAPQIQGNSSLSSVGPFHLGNADVVVIQDNGGNGCPALLHIVSVKQTGLSVTPEFGSCSDFVRIDQVGSSLKITMPGFMGPGESEASKRAAAKKRFVYRFSVGRLTLNGKLVKAD